MAGTGHSWEVANASAARAFAERLAGSAPEGHGQAWFRSRKFLRHLTDERFCVRLSDKADGSGFDTGDRDLMLAKLAGGSDVRAFSVALVETLGGAYAHLCDWMDWLKRNDAAGYGKLPRISVDDAFAKADRWSLLMSEGSEGTDAGRREAFMTVQSGRTWMRLADAEALKAEGAAMRHCVGDYARHVETGTSSVYSLRNEDGRPSVTAEIRNRDGVPYLAQARGVGNGAVPPGAQQDLAELLGALGAQRSPAAEAAGVCLLDNGRWGRVIDTWERCDAFGQPAVRSGRRMVVLSPVQPGIALAAVTLVEGASNGVKGVVTALEARHFHIDEIRAYAALKNGFGDLVARDGEPDVCLADGKMTARRDAWPGTEIAGRLLLAETRIEGVVHHMVHRSDKARSLLTVGPGKHVLSPLDHMHGSRSVVAKTWTPERWTEDDARDAMAAMDFLQAVHVSRAEGTPDRFQFQRADGRWRSFAMDSATEPAVLIAGTWSAASYAAVLVPEGGGSRASLSFGPDGSVTALHDVFCEAGSLPEIARFLNARNASVGRRTFGFEEQPDVLSTIHATRGRLFWFRGRWMTSAGPAAMLEMAWRAGKGKAPRLDASEAESLLAAFPGDPAPPAGEARAVLASAISAWARGWRESEDRVAFHSSGFPWRPKRPWQQSDEGRLRAAVHVRDLLGPRDMARLGRIARSVARKALSLRRGKAFEDPLRGTIGHLLLEWGDCLSDSAFVRCLKRFSKDGLIEESSRAPSAGWAGRPCERASGLSDRSGRSALWPLRDGAEKSFWRLSLPSEGKQHVPLTLSEAHGWIACLSLSRPVSSFSYLRNARKLADALAAAAPSPDGEWASLIAAARDAADEAEAEDRGRYPSLYRKEQTFIDTMESA